MTTAFWCILAAALLPYICVGLAKYQPGYNNCWQLRYLDVSAVTAVSVFGGTQPRNGRGSTWYGDQILTNGRKPPDSMGKCADTGMITRIDPATSAETALVRGYDPDSR